MSMPTFPEIRPGFNFEDSVLQIISSIAMQEVGLSHIINAEGEKIQYAIGTLPGAPSPNLTLDQLLAVNNSVQETLKNISFAEMSLNAKFSDALKAYLAYLKQGGNVVTTFLLTVVNGTGSGEYAPGTRVPITADPVPDGMFFAGWTGGNGGRFENINSMSTIFTMPNGAATATAIYLPIGSVTQHLTVVNGTGSGDYLAGMQIPITADDAPEGMIFARWTGGNGGSFENANSASTTFTLPNNDATVTATYRSVFALTVESGTGSGIYAPGELVFITADPAPNGMYFTGWVGGDGGIFANASSASTYFVMPSSATTVSATYQYIGMNSNYLTVQGGSGSGEYVAGSTVMISADAAPAGQVFAGWVGGNGGTFANANNATTAFTMPDNEATVTATYQNIYSLVVANGSGSGSYTQGTVVTITANPAPEGQVFDRWSGGDGGSFGNMNSISTTFTMPASATTVTAVYRSSLPNIPGLNSSTQLCSSVTIDSRPWFVARTTTDSTARYFLLVSEYILNQAPFNTPNNSVYEGSNLQAEMTKWFTSGYFNTIRQNAVVPNLGNPTNGKNVTTEPTSVLASANNTTRDIFFALTWQDGMNWGGKCTNLGYADHWWTRSAYNVGASWEFNPIYYSEHLSEFFSTNGTTTNRGILPAVWVKVPL